MRTVKCSLLLDSIEWTDLVPRCAKTSVPPPPLPACAPDSSAFHIWDGRYLCSSYARCRFSYNDATLLGFNPLARPSSKPYGERSVRSRWRLRNHRNQPHPGMPSLKGVQRSWVISATFLRSSKTETGCAWSCMSCIHLTRALSSSTVSTPCLPLFRLSVLPWKWSRRDVAGMPKSLAAVASW